MGRLATELVQGDVLLVRRVPENVDAGWWLFRRTYLIDYEMPLRDIRTILLVERR